MESSMKALKISSTRGGFRVEYANRNRDMPMRLLAASMLLAHFRASRIVF